MKSSIYLVIMLILVSCSSYDTHSKNEIEDYLQNLNFFEAKKTLEASKDKLSEQDYLYFSGIINNAFNKNAASLQNFQELLDNYSTNLSDSLKAKVLNTQLNTYLKIFQYEKGKSTGEELINKYSEQLKPEILEDAQNTLDICSILKKTSAQTIRKSQLNKVVLPIVRDKVNLQRISVKINDVEKKMIYDTGANLSLMSESFAKEVGVQILDGLVTVGTGTDDVKVPLGVVKSMYLGDILFENIIFLIFPDEMLYSSEIDYYMDAIIGYPVMSQLGEFTIDNVAKQLIIPAKPKLEGESNFALNELNLVVQATYRTENLLFHFDSGADNTNLFSKYYKKHKTELDSLQLEQSQIIIQGAGGTKEIETSSIPNFEIEIASKNIKFDSIDLYFQDSEYDGRMGQDVISNLNKLTLNFNKMIIKVE